MDNIFLVGMMGSGKTTTAKELSKLCNYPVVDLDRIIEEIAGKTINRIFLEDGESTFREIEKKALTKITSPEYYQVISPNRLPLITGTSGGLVLQSSNIEWIKKRGIVVYLKTSLPVLWERVKNSKNRPLLQQKNPREAFEAIFNARIPLYETVASLSVVTDGKTPKQVAEELYKKLFHEKN